MSLAATLALNVPAITALCTGPRGPQGATIFTGSGVPLTANGLVGDIYIDVQNSYLYGPKPLSSSWGSAQTLTAATTAITTYIPSVLSAYNFVTYTNYYSGAPFTYASTGQDITYTPLTLMGYTSSYLQSYIQNFSPTISASTDFVVANDIGAYIDLGVNGSNYNGNLYTPKFNINGPNDSYLYNSFGNMTIGTGGGGGDFIIFTNGTLSGTHAQGGNESVRVKANGNVGINTQFPNTNLTVVGNISATGGLSAASVLSNTGIFNNNVGVGTVSPNQTLTVVGSISSTGGITVGSPTNTLTGNYTLRDSDCNGIIYFNNTSPLSAVLPNPSTVRDGFQVTIIQAGTGQVGVSANSNTLHQAYSLYHTSAQWSAATLTYNTTFGWTLFGDLA